jgi:hypothetical protein
MYGMFCIHILFVNIKLNYPLCSLATPPVGPPIDPAIKAKQDELHERIISILNRPAPPPVDSTKMSTAYSATGAGPGSSVSITPELNASLQRAIDSLIKTGKVQI